MNPRTYAAALQKAIRIHRSQVVVPRIDKKNWRFSSNREEAVIAELIHPIKIIPTLNIKFVYIQYNSAVLYEPLRLLIYKKKNVEQ